MLRTTLRVAFVLSFLAGVNAIARANDETHPQAPPEIGDKARDFTLNDLDNKPLTLDEQLKNGTTVLVVLRGYPGYQCPICTKQFGELMGKAKQFADAKASVVFVYPGPAADLDKYAKEFIGSKTFPDNYRFVIDPDYKFTELYHLRWNAPKETAYPSSFVIDRNGIIQYAKVSHSHGDRAKSDDLLEAAKKLEP